MRFAISDAMRSAMSAAVFLVLAVLLVVVGWLLAGGAVGVGGVGAESQTDETLPPVVTHEGYECVPAKVHDLAVPNTHVRCTAGFQMTTQADPGYCKKSEDKNKKCRTGFKKTYKLLAHYDIREYPEDPTQEATCKHVETDLGAREVEDCRAE